MLWIAAGNTRRDTQPSGAFECLRRDPSTGLTELKSGQFDAILLDFPLPHLTASELFEQIQGVAPETPVVIRDAEASVAESLRLARKGAYPAITQDEEIAATIERAIEEHREGKAVFSGAGDKPEDWRSLLVGKSQEMARVCHIIRMVGNRRSTVLITGETGTGKEVAARALHLAGPRRRGPWVAVNCSALPGTLLESELFGYVRGAFTGASQTRIGRFEQANGGTLFLDEIGDMPLELQAKLLRVLQERELQRLGSSETIRLDVRVIAATNCHLQEKVANGQFREDLYYRLNVVPLELPPLRERPDDIPLLAAHFVEKICRTENIPMKQISPQGLERLRAFSWPGNIRQLENAIEMAVALSGDLAILSASDFPLGRTGATRDSSSAAAPVSIPETGLDFEKTLAVIERSILSQALEKTRGNKKAAAEMLGLKRTTLSAKIRTLEAAACVSA